MNLNLHGGTEFEHSGSVSIPIRDLMNLNQIKEQNKF